MSSQFGEWKVEDWYESIEDLTFETYFIDLTMREALTIQYAYEYNKKGDTTKYKEEEKEIIEKVKKKKKF